MKDLMAEAGIVRLAGDATVRTVGGIEGGCPSGTTGTGPRQVIRGGSAGVWTARGRGGTITEIREGETGVATPKLSHPSSGLGGRGYRDVFGAGEVLPSVTTALGALDRPGILDFHIKNTAYYAVRNIDELLSRTEEAGERFLQYYTRRLKPEKLDNPEVDVLSFSYGVLDDLASTGNFIHDHVESYLNGWIPEEPWREDQAEMVLAFYEWLEGNEVELQVSEATVFGNGYAGTLDMIAKINGVPYLVDIKTSRAVHESHVAQLAALGAAHSMATEVAEGTEGAVYHKIVPSVSRHHAGQVDSWWVEEPVPAFQQYGILQIRPGDYDNDGNYIPPFCKLHTIPHRQVESAFGIFEAGLAARIAQREYNQVVKQLENEEGPF